MTEPEHWIEVTSSNVAAIGHDDPTMDVYVRFLNNATYVYHAVPFWIVHQFLASPSKGAYLAAHIKGGYRCTKLDQPAEEAV